MVTFLYNGLLVTTIQSRFGSRYDSVLLPNGQLITGPSRSINFLRHYSSNTLSSNPSLPEKTPVNPVSSYSNLTDPSVLSNIKAVLKGEAGVYAFQLIETGEILYIGSSVNLAFRFYQHFKNYSSNIALQRAFSKYGISGFNFLILAEYTVQKDISVQENRDALLALEQQFLEQYSPRYNILPIAGSPLGFSHSEETKAKLSALAKQNMTEERKSQLIKILSQYWSTSSFSGLHHSSPPFGGGRPPGSARGAEETKKLMSESRKGKLNPMFGKEKSPEFLNQQTRDKSGPNNPMFGKSWTDSQRIANCTPIYVFDSRTQELITQYPGIVEAKKDLRMGYDTLKQ